jgi:hypothetical protein
MAMPCCAARVPAREERGQRQLGEHDEIAFLLCRLVEQRDHARNHGLAALGLLDRSALGGGDAEDAGHDINVRVMAGLVPAIHVFKFDEKQRRGCPAQGRA